ncbi:MAG TPA: YetF domain-containing protein [Gemmatimonadaceae bacterium]|nr:YetF domain-containing protein [Gemmatimonadaceae bacterium]
MFHSLLAPGIPVTEKLLRTFLVYVFLLVGLRLAGKREMGQLNPFDFVVLLLLANTVQNAIIGNDNSLVGGIIGATALLIVNWFVVRYLYTHPAIARLVEGDPDLLIRNGKLRADRLKRELITPEELEAAARRQGIEGLHRVETCRLEIGGALTFVAKEPTEEEKRHGELVKHLESLKQSHAALLARVAQIERL